MESLELSGREQVNTGFKRGHINAVSPARQDSSYRVRWDCIIRKAGAPGVFGEKKQALLVIVGPKLVVANTEKKVPREWINEEGNGLKQAFIDYAMPLIQGETEMVKEDGLPRFAKLKKIFAK